MTTPKFRNIRKVEVVPPQPEWPGLFQEEAARLQGVFGKQVIAIHHVGSTAVRGIKAKPIIDFLVEVHNIQAIDALNEGMQDLGYEAAGEYGIPGRRFFSRMEGNYRIRNVHVFQAGHPEIGRMLAFCDFLNSHPEQALAYSRLKEDLAQRFPEDIDRYTEGKREFIHQILAQAGQVEREGNPDEPPRRYQEESCGDHPDSGGQPL